MLDVQNQVIIQFGFSWGFSPWIANGNFFLYLRMVFPLYIRILSVFQCIQMSFSCKDTSRIGLSHPSKLHRLFKDLISEYSNILRYWGLGLQHMNLAGVGVQNSAQNKEGTLPNSVYEALLSW